MRTERFGKSIIRRQAFLILTVTGILWGCVQNMRRSSGFPTPDDLEESKTVPTDSARAKVIVIGKAEDLVKSSDVIESVKYIPLETSPDALLGYYQNIAIYKGRIYVLDRIAAKAVIIFDMEGRFLKKLGSTGGGPEEFYLLAGFGIDRRNDHLVLYDNRKRRMMYYTLDGNFIKAVNVAYRFFGNFAFLPSGNMVSAVSKNDGNFHLGRFDDYRLIYSDTTGRMRQFGFKYDDNIDLPAGWSELYFCGDEILYYPQYLNSIYSVTDSAIRQKYIIDCRNFTPFDQKRIAQYNDWDKFCEYWYSTTNLESKIAETGDHLYFGVNNKRQLQYYFYNKRTQTLTGFKTMLLDREFAVEFSRLYSYGEYFVGTAPVPLLKELKAYKDRMGEQMSDGIGDMIDRLKEEDNDVLVLFKLKQPEA